MKLCKIIRHIVVSGLILIFIAVVSLSVNAENRFESTIPSNPFGMFSPHIEFDDYFYGISYDSQLRQLNETSETNITLAEKVQDFITDNETLYYITWENAGIYKINLANMTTSKVFDGEVTSLLNCYKNKYLYYYIYSDYDVNSEYQTWRLDMETGKSEMIMSNSMISFYVCEDKIYYAPFNGDNTSTNLFVSELDGSNERILIHDICDFELFDDYIYYAKCDKDIGNSRADFHIERCGLNGQHSMIMSDRIYDRCIHYIGEKTDSVIADDHLEYYDYYEEITVLIDGEKVYFDQPPIIIDDRTLVPLRAIFEALGAQVDWDGNTQTITSKKGETKIVMTIGKPQMYKNEEIVALDVAPQLISDRTVVPVRAIAEAFGCDVEWNGETSTVIITTDADEYY